MATKVEQDDSKEDGGFPTISRQLSRMSIDGARSSPVKSPYALSGSPKSPSLSRKSSSTFLHRPDDRPSPRRFSSGRAPSLTDEKPRATAASISKEYFQKELMYHLGSDMQDTDTLVLTHDSCYGHRYSRQKTSKSTLNLIMERPERMQAGM